MIRDSARPRRLRRNPRACDQCSRRSVKCKPPTDDETRCQNCVDFDEPCTLDRPSRRRGAQALPEWPRRRTDTSSCQVGDAGREGTNARQPSLGLTPTGPRQDEWAPRVIHNQALVTDLTDVFFEVIYPIFPLFHRPTLLRRVSRGEHTTDRALYAAVAAMCALSSARARDGALYNPAWNVESLQEPSSESFFASAEEALPKDAVITQRLGYMQCCVLLAITSIQYGDSTKTQLYLNMYHSFVAVGSLHDEEQWPQDLSLIEVEERRRLFWSTYTLDVFTSIIWKRVARGGEAAFSVSYPSESDDDPFHDTGSINSTNWTKEGSLSWLEGWNFVTDLYRILEHILHLLGHLRPKSQRTPAICLPIFDGSHSKAALLDYVMTRYNQLPAVFKSTCPIADKLSDDLFSFQAANIAATVQLVRMVLFTIEGSTVDQKCQVASEVLGVFANVPEAYLRAISSPLLHHLTGIGIIMGNAFHDGLSESSYMRVRQVLLELAALITRLETGNHCSAGISDKLRVQVGSIDAYWNSQKHRQAIQSGTMWESAFPNEQQQLTVGTLQHNVPSAGNIKNTSVGTESSPVYFPPELLDNWSWVFDVA